MGTPFPNKELRIWLHLYGETANQSSEPVCVSKS